MFLHGIRFRLMVPFVGLVVAILAAAGWTLQWVTRRSMEAELGRKLEAVAGAVSVTVREEERRILLSGFGPRTEPYLRRPLESVEQATGVERIFFFDLKGGILFDTDAAPGRPYSDFALQFYRNEVDRVRRGEKAHSILFKGIDGLPTMSGFAPFFLEERVAGGVGVDGSATFLEAVDALKRRLIVIGFLGALAAVVGAAVVSATLTRPIRDLVVSSALIGRGRLDEPVRVRGRSEIALLARTMEGMRKDLVDRERDLKTMLAGVAHEIRNPLGAIELFTGLLSREVADRPAARAQAERISSEVQSLKRIVDSFLEFAKPEEPEKENLAAGPLIRDALALLVEARADRSIVFAVDPSLETTALRVDPVHFKRIALNLLQNAVQAMPRGGTVTIQGGCTDGGVRICFADTGPGMPESVRKNLFKPFFTTREKGTGLGLSIVKKLIERNGGTVALVRSGPDGTEFCITLERGHRP